jgi:ATP-dependent helicase/nuclease subunit A
MTVHGAKGLQAPIVILPDAGESGKGKSDPLLWGEDLVMLRPSQANDTEQTRGLKEEQKNQEEQEQCRLLYVALTRAQDRLYIGGWVRSGKEAPQDCWYRLIQDALELKAGTGAASYQQGTLSLPEKLLEETSSLPAILPSWIMEKPAQGYFVKEKAEKPPSSSTAAIERGILIHRFFEVLPDLPVALRYQAACQTLAKEKLDLQTWEDDIQATLKIIEDPAFQEIFGPDSYSEVPVSGMMNGVPFQGRLDRLHVTQDTLTIIDYKTTRNPPKDVAEIPQNYIEQLEGYAQALAPLYPGHRIRKLLVWTEGPLIQEVAS